MRRLLSILLIFILVGCYSKPLLDRTDHDRHSKEKTPSIYSDNEHTQITRAICNKKNAEAIELIKIANHSEWLVSYKVWREVAAGKKVTVLGTTLLDKNKRLISKSQKPYASLWCLSNFTLMLDLYYPIIRNVLLKKST